MLLRDYHSYQMCFDLFSFICLLDRVITRLQNWRREKTVYSKKSFVQFSLVLGPY